MKAVVCPRASGFPLSSAVIREIEREFPKFKLVPKRTSRLQRGIGILLRIITLGSQDRYMSHYHTVMGETLYLPVCWPSSSDTSRAILLRHERVHLRQRRHYGPFLFALIYLLPILPMGLAYGRARLEWEAYRETLRATRELCGLETLQRPELRQEILQRFTGGDYGWMWPFPSSVGRWFDEAVEQLAGAPSPPRSPPSVNPSASA